MANKRYRERYDNDEYVERYDSRNARDDDRDDTNWLPLLIIPLLVLGLLWGGYNLYNRSKQDQAQSHNQQDNQKTGVGEGPRTSPTPAAEYYRYQPSPTR